MFHFLEYPFSRGFTHITSPSPYDAPDFDAGFMNDKRDMAPMVWGYIQSRETARRMDAYAGEVTNMHPHFAYNSPARATDMDIATRNAYGGPDHITSNIQHGSWTMPVKTGKVSEANVLNSNAQMEYEPLKYSKEDIGHIEKVSRAPRTICPRCPRWLSFPSLLGATHANMRRLVGTTSLRDHLAFSRNLLHGPEGRQQHREAWCTGRTPQRPRRQASQGCRPFNMSRQCRLQHFLGKYQTFLHL
jgi:hypothetical protein